MWISRHIYTRLLSLVINHVHKIAYRQFGQNVNRSRKEIRAILSARNRPSPRELSVSRCYHETSLMFVVKTNLLTSFFSVSLLCTSSTQQSSSCIARRNDAGRMRRHHNKYRTSNDTDMKSSSRIQSSSMSSSELVSIAKCR
ncbi:hypothetical protein LOAG_07800 [Loa loa]|uniref:Uncharacterized protein n=1 Tax=Loa loa TaxID=7209 RepID=A0A1S0TV51_LOALO|nr:hypothetical protein LOAG_07800 [Loa loa]EFO20689.1 hypothetical protein LOAG_07800 [Loa loa]